jgi:cytochrome c556
MSQLLLVSLLTIWAVQPTDRVPMSTVRDAMKKLNGGPNSLHSSLTRDLKEEDPDWEGIQADTAEYVKQTDILLKNKPKKGTAASWETLAKAYNTDAQALNAAAKRKDARTTAAVLRRISGTCMTCHKAHRPE